MKYYYVNVEDRQSHDVVTVGSMLTLDEVCHLISVLLHYNATDLLIYKCEENLIK